MRLSIGGLQGFSFCAEISVRLFTVCFCCLLFLYFSKMLWRERPRLSGWNTLNNPAHFAFFSWEEEKNWIYPGTSSGHSGYTSTTTTVWLIHSRRRRSVGCIFIRFCIASFVRSFGCLYVQFLFCQSVPKHKHRHVFLCHWNPVIDNLIW